MKKLFFEYDMQISHFVDIIGEIGAKKMHLDGLGFWKKIYRHSGHKLYCSTGQWKSE